MSTTGSIRAGLVPSHPDESGRPLQAASGPNDILGRNGTCSFGQRWHVGKTCRDDVATNNVNSLEEQLR